MFSEDYYSLDRFDLCLCTSPRTQPQRLLQGHFNRMGIENRPARQAMCYGMFIYTSCISFSSPFFSPPLNLSCFCCHLGGGFNLWLTESSRDTKLRFPSVDVSSWGWIYVHAKLYLQELREAVKKKIPRGMRSLICTCCKFNSILFV